MKVIKILGIVILIAVIAIAGVAYYLYQNLDSLLKDAIETYGTQAIGTQVTLNDIHVDLGNGKVSLNGLVIDNPPGYTSEYAMSLRQATVQFNYDSIQQKVIILDEILVDAPSIIAEEKNMKDINLKTLSDNLNASSASEPAPESEPLPEPSGESPSEPLLMVRKFTFSNAGLSLISSQYGDRDINMPTIQAENLGAPNGVTPNVLAQQMLKQILDQANEQIKKSVKKAARKKLKEKAEKELEERLSDDDREKLDDLKSLFKKD